MLPVGRSYKELNEKHLRALAEIAEKERNDFFTRNPRQIAFYKNRFLAAALCQGAALHYLGLGNGVKDFDIHFFYEQHPVRKQMARAVRSVIIDVPDHGRRQVDFIRTVVPPRFVAEGKDNVSVVIRKFLEGRPTQNARRLANKAVIGLIPEASFAMVIWRGANRESPTSVG